MKPLSLNTKISIAVVFIHAVLLALITSSETKPKQSPKKLVVITKKLEPKIVPAQTFSPKIVKTQPIKEKKPEPITKITKQVKNLPTKKKVPQKTAKQVLKKIDQRHAKVKAPPSNKKPPPEKKNIASTFSENKESLNLETPLPSYIESACQIFKDALVLPEKGEVKLTVTVEPSGKIGKMEIETFESKHNLDYLLAFLPTLTLPAPENGKEIIFTVLFCND